MAAIRYVCLSDLHLGEEDGLLTNIDGEGRLDFSSPAPVLKELAGRLEGLIEAINGGEAPTLVLCGDVLEMALAEVNEALLAFGQLMALVLGGGRELFREVIYVPGNHDHHVWEMAREAQYRQYFERLSESERLEPPWNTTKVFMDFGGRDRLVSAFLTAAARKFGGAEGTRSEVLVAYPNFGVWERGGGADRAVIFHHGHYVERLYMAASIAASYVLPGYELPKDVYELEKENFAWIDFFWSSMGRSAPGVETVYESLGSEERWGKLVDQLARSVAERHRFPRWCPGFLRERLLRAWFRCWARRYLGKGTERQRKAETGEIPLSPEAQLGLEHYLGCFVKRQIEVEEGELPGAMTFVFGHTHKPFVKVWKVAEFGRPVAVCNTGGWVVESVEVVEARGGTVLLLDERLEGVALRIYREGEYEVTVEGVGGVDGRGELVRGVERHLERYGADWRRLGEVVAAEVEKRRRLLARRLGLQGSGVTAS